MGRIPSPRRALGGLLITLGTFALALLAARWLASLVKP